MEHASPPKQGLEALGASQVDDCAAKSMDVQVIVAEQSIFIDAGRRVNENRKYAPRAKPRRVRGIDLLQKRLAVLALRGCKSNLRFLYSRPRHRWRIDFLACFGGHQSNEDFLYSAGCLTTSSQKTHSDGFLYSSG
jgi:hypothetical protein